MRAHTHTRARARVRMLLSSRMTNLQIIVKYVLAIDFNLNSNIMQLQSGKILLCVRV